jgi:hypothetical protein
MLLLIVYHNILRNHVLNFIRIHMMSGILMYGRMDRAPAGCWGPASMMNFIRDYSGV